MNFVAPRIGLEPNRVRAAVSDSEPEPVRLRRFDTRPADLFDQQPAHRESLIADHFRIEPEARTAGEQPVFLEEAVGPEAIGEFVKLCQALTGKVKVTGGEIVTTEREMRDRIDRGCYDIAQPDATVIGGISPVLRLFRHCQKRVTDVWVHCWGGPVGMMANYHAAMAGGGSVVEWPMPDYGIRHEMVVEPWAIQGGQLQLSDAPGLGVELTDQIERKYAFREDAVYACLVDASKAPQNVDWSL